MDQASTWFIKPPNDDTVYGPYSTESIQQFLSLGKINGDFLASLDRNDWQTVSKIMIPKTQRLEQEPPQGQNSQKFGDYWLLQELGRGGSGIVYKAQEMALPRVVALKILISQGHERDVQRFLREVNLTAKLEHPNIVRVFTRGENPQPFYTMEYIQGQPLHHFLRAQPLNLQQKTSLFLKICHGIEYAHKHKIIHRDIKPANILMDKNGEPKVTDFGLAREIAGKDLVKLSVSGEIMGTPQYMSPEQANGKELDQRTDIYSLGAMFYEMMTGRPPFEGDDFFSLLGQLANNDPIPPRALNPSISIELELICLKCLEKIPRKRYRTVGLLRLDLEHFLENRPISLRPPGIVEKSVKWLIRNKIAAAIGMSLLLALVFCIIAMFKTIKLQEQEHQTMINKEYQKGCELFHTQPADEKACLKAQRAFSDAITKSPRWWGNRGYESYWMRGAAHFITSNYSLAESDFATALTWSQTKEDKCQLALCLSLCNAEQKKWDASKTWYAKAREIFGVTDARLTQYLQEMQDRHCEKIPVMFRMPLPYQELTMPNSRYFLISSLLPDSVLEEICRRMTVASGAEKSAKGTVAAMISHHFSLEEQLVKIGYLLDKDPQGWIQSMLQQAAPTFSELKEMIFYFQNKWILDMASPFWAYLDHASQTNYAQLYQQFYAKELGEPRCKEFSFKKRPGGNRPDVSAVPIEMAFIPPGQFLMGTQQSFGDESPQHLVIIQQFFWIGTTEFTQGQLELANGYKLSEHVEKEQFKEEFWGYVKEHPQFPSVRVSPDTVQKNFFTHLDSPLSLTDEPRWEYACRAGTTTPFYWGMHINSDYLWYAANAWEQNVNCCRQVKQKKANSWGIYDMSGNAAERCLINGDQYRYPNRRLIHPHQNERPLSWKNLLFVQRGGAVDNYDYRCQSATRQRNFNDADYNPFLSYRLIFLGENK